MACFEYAVHLSWKALDHPTRRSLSDHMTNVVVPGSESMNSGVVRIGDGLPFRVIVVFFWLSESGWGSWSILVLLLTHSLQEWQ